MRARNIKPGFFGNEDLLDCSFATRLLFIGLWMLADREGRLEDRPKRIKLKLFPWDDIDINLLLNELQDHDFIIRYEVEEGHFMQIKKFSKHQNPHRNEAESKIPPCPDELLTMARKTSDHGEHKGQPGNKALRPDSLILCISDSLKNTYPQSDASGGQTEYLDQPEATPEKMANQHVGQPQDGETPEKIAGMSVGYPPEFEEFWKHYPRKVEKKVAFSAWKTEARTIAAKQEVVRAAMHYKAWAVSAQKSPEFLKHGATFLHKERWRDWINGPPESGETVGGITDAEMNAIRQKHTKGGECDLKAATLEIRALKRERGIE